MNITSTVLSKSKTRPNAICEKIQRSVAITIWVCFWNITARFKRLTMLRIRLYWGVQHPLRESHGITPIQYHTVRSTTKGKKSYVVTYLGSFVFVFIEIAHRPVENTICYVGFRLYHVQFGPPHQGVHMCSLYGQDKTYVSVIKEHSSNPIHYFLLLVTIDAMLRSTITWMQKQLWMLNLRVHLQRDYFLETLHYNDCISAIIRLSPQQQTEILLGPRNKL